MSSSLDKACEVVVLDPEGTDLRVTADSILERFRDLGVPVPPIDSGLLDDLSTVPLSER